MYIAGLVIFHLFVIAVLISTLIWLIKRVGRKDRQPLAFSRLVRWRNKLPGPSLRAARWLDQAIIALEIALIVGWAIWAGRAYLDFNLRTWPTGREYGLSIQSAFRWADLLKCGACFLWLRILPAKSSIGQPHAQNSSP